MNTDYFIYHMHHEDRKIIAFDMGSNKLERLNIAFHKVFVNGMFGFQSRPI
jgi:hypothetical protein